MAQLSMFADQAPKAPAPTADLDRVRRKLAAFLTEAKARLGLANVTIKPVDIATMRATYDVVTARALASLDKLFFMAQPLMGQGAIGLFPKGVGVEKELAAAQQNWVVEYAKKPSVTQEGSSIILVSNLKHITQ